MNRNAYHYDLFRPRDQIEVQTFKGHRGHGEGVDLLQQIAEENADGGQSPPAGRTRARYHGMKAGQLPEELLARFRKKEKKKTAARDIWGVMVKATMQTYAANNYMWISYMWISVNNTPRRESSCTRSGRRVSSSPRLPSS